MFNCPLLPVMISLIELNQIVGLTINVYNKLLKIYIQDNCKHEGNKTTRHGSKYWVFSCLTGHDKQLAVYLDRRQTVPESSCLKDSYQRTNHFCELPF